MNFSNVVISFLKVLVNVSDFPCTIVLKGISTYAWDTHDFHLKKNRNFCMDRLKIYYSVITTFHFLLKNRFGCLI